MLGLLVVACTEEQQDDRQRDTISTSQQQTQPKVRIQVPNFNADSAFHFVKKQLDFGPRVPGSAGHKACGDWLVQKLGAYELLVQEQPFEAKAYDGTILNGRNIIATAFPKKKKRILLAAHWDTRPFADHDNQDQDQPIPGANDGASGVAVLLELTRALQAADNKPDVGVDIILFDLEDYGAPDHKPSNFNPSQEVYWCLGSQYWSNNKHLPGYSAYFGILLDMVGAPGATFYKEGSSMQFAPKVVDKVWGTAQRLGYGAFFVQAPANGAITDDHIFVNRDAGINMIDIIHHDPSSPTYFAHYWHTHKDDLSNIDPNTLKAVGQTVLQVLYEE